MRACKIADSVGFMRGKDKPAWSQVLESILIATANRFLIGINDHTKIGDRRQTSYTRL